MVKKLYLKIKHLYRLVFPIRLRDRYPVGAGTYGEPKVFSFGRAGGLKVGSYSSISAGVTIIVGGEHRMDWLTTFPFPEFWEECKAFEGYHVSKGDVIIGNDVWIGYGATIMSGVTIGDGAVVGARSVVTKDIPAYAIVAGSPAKFIRSRFSPENVALLQEIKWWEWGREQIVLAMPFLMSNNISGLARYAESSSGRPCQADSHE